eukprot:gene2800-3592_t
MAPKKEGATKKPAAKAKGKSEGPKKVKATKGKGKAKANAEEAVAEGGEVEEAPTPQAPTEEAVEEAMPLVEPEVAKEEEEVVDVLEAGLAIGLVGEDPWAIKADRGEEWDALEQEQADRGTDIAVEAKIREETGSEQAGGIMLIASDLHLDTFPVGGRKGLREDEEVAGDGRHKGDMPHTNAEAPAKSDFTRSHAVSLDLTNNKLSKMDSLLANGWLWLRELKLTGNKLKGWPRGLSGLPALLTLDLSFNGGLDLKGADLTPLVGHPRELASDIEAYLSMHSRVTPSAKIVQDRHHLNIRGDAADEPPSGGQRAAMRSVTAARTVLSSVRDAVGRIAQSRRADAPGVGGGRVDARAVLQL